MSDLSACTDADLPLLLELAPQLDPRWKLSAPQAERLARLGAHALAAGDTDAAIAAFEIARQSWSSADACKAFAVALVKFGRQAEALAELRVAARLAPADVETFCMIGELCLDALDYHAALHALYTAITLDPTSTHPSGARARALVKKGAKLVQSALAG